MQNVAILGYASTMAQISTFLVIIIFNLVQSMLLDLLNLSYRYMQRCDECTGWAESYPGCWVNGVWRRQCHRGLTIHQDLSDEAIAELSEEDRRRHLYIVGLCKEAKTGVSVAIEEAQDLGIIPVPESGTLIEKCLYEYV